MRSPSGEQSIGAWFNANNRISGDSTDGIYEVEVTIPAFSEPGEWTVSFIETQDNVGNHDFQHVDNADANIPSRLAVTIDVSNDSFGDGSAVGEISPSDFDRAELFVDESNLKIIDFFFGGEISEPQDRSQIAQRFQVYLNGVESSVLDGGDWLPDGANPGRNDFSIDLGDITLKNTDRLEVYYSFDVNDGLGDYLRTA